MPAEELYEEEGEYQESGRKVLFSEIKEIMRKWTELPIVVENTQPHRRKANH